jgi:hypothetical protein
LTEILVNSLKPKKNKRGEERKGEEKVWGAGVTIDTIFNGWGEHKFTDMKVPRQCPLVLLVKVD